MVINNRKKLLLIVSLALLFVSLGNFRAYRRLNAQIQNSILKANAPTLPDKVYLFQSPQDSLLLEDLVLEQYYLYYLLIEIVTPHNCTANITLWDPEGHQFNIFENRLYVEPEGANYFEIPFGTAISGNYDFLFEVITLENMNLHIRMEKGPKCLLNKLPLEELDSVKLYKVTRFSNEGYVNHTIMLNIDYMYKFYVGRVSPISFMEDNEIKIDLSLEDPEGIIYTIFYNTTLAGIDDINWFKFGTAIGGFYNFNITIRCNVENVNIGYSVIDLYQIGSGSETNLTEPTTNSTILNQYFFMPTEWTIGILGFAGTISAIIGVLLYKQKKKPFLNSNL
ncbi:MAG: hypothetical protein ACFFE4_05685 [Candidatus Thorarchaeota archaeon]